MAQDIVLFLIEQFKNTVESEQDDKFPFKTKFVEMKNELKKFSLELSAYLSEDELRESIYELNDVFVECQTLRRKQQGCKFGRLDCSTPAELLSCQRKAKARLQNIKRTLEAIKKKPPPTSVQPVDQSESTSKPKEEDEWTSADVDETTIYGWDDDVKKIRDILIPIIDDKKLATNHDLKLIGIVGMFGTGKTAFAQKIFTNEDVMDHFPLRLWVWVSPKCQKEELVRRMLDNLGMDSEKIDYLLGIDPSKDRVGVLLFLLHLQLLNKRYLIVFDDIHPDDDWYTSLNVDWALDSEWTHQLAYGLPKGNGSAIIMTSRREEVAQKMVGDNGTILRPPPLLGEGGWSLFKTAFEEASGKQDSDDLKKYEKYKERIAKKCNGIPLALKAVGEKLGSTNAESQT